MNGRYKHVMSTKNMIATNSQISSGQILDNNTLSYKLNKDQEDSTVLVESPSNNAYLNIRVKYEHNIEDIEFLMYTKSKQEYTFIFKLTNQDDKLNIKQHYFALRKKFDEVQQLGERRESVLV